MKRTLILLLAACCLSCGLSDDPSDDRNKTVYITFTDPAFEAFCLAHCDFDGDGRVSRYEAQRVGTIDCSGLGIRWLPEIGEFCYLQTLDCSDNALTDLDLHACTALLNVDCSGNGITRLDMDNLNRLQTLDCSDNPLTSLTLAYRSLSSFDGHDNRFSVLDFRLCSPDLTADVRGNTVALTVYALSSQRIETDGETTVVND